MGNTVKIDSGKTKMIAHQGLYGLERGNTNMGSGGVRCKSGCVSCVYLRLHKISDTEVDQKWCASGKWNCRKAKCHNQKRRSDQINGPRNRTIGSCSAGYSDRYRL